MPIQHSQQHCPTCRRATMHVRNDSQVNHILHLLASVFLCGLWLPIWFYLALTRALAGGEPWRCQSCGTAAGLFGGSGAAPIAFAAKPAGPSNWAKATGDRCPSCGGAMVPGFELGAEVMSCGRCGQTYERAGE